MMANRAKNFINAFGTQAMRSGQYSGAAIRARMVSRAVTAGGTAAKGSMSGLGGLLKTGMGNIRREAMTSGKSLGFHVPGMIGAGIGAAYGGYNDATGRRGPGLISGDLMGAAGGYGFRASTMGSVQAVGRDLMSNARIIQKLQTTTIL